MQTAAITRALPFAVVMIFISYGLLRALQTEGRSTDVGHATAMPALGGSGPNWRQRWSSIVQHHEKDELQSYLDRVAMLALSEVAEQVKESGLSPSIARKDDSVTLSIDHGERGAFAYTVRIRGFRTPSFAWIDPGKEDGRKDRHYRMLGRSSEDAQEQDLTGSTANQVIHAFLARYAHFRQATQSLPGWKS